MGELIHDDGDALSVLTCKAVTQEISSLSGVSMTTELIHSGEKRRIHGG